MSAIIRKSALTAPFTILSPACRLRRGGGSCCAGSMPETARSASSAPSDSRPAGGTVGLLHRHKAGSELLRKLWAETLPDSRRGDDPWDVIQVGRYRTQPRTRSGVRLDD